MSVNVHLLDLLAACEWVSGSEAEAMNCRAYVSRETGEIHWLGEGIEEEPPEDIDDESLYIPVPQKSDFDLGRSLVMRFVEEHIPDSRETVREFFRRRGAYSRLKLLLDRVGQLDRWHHYEQAGIEEALRKWCEKNDLTLIP
jgi:hypothetical protein